MRNPVPVRAEKTTVALAVALVVGLVLRLPTFGRALLSDDEAIYAATADAMRTGALLYRDAVDHKPPLIYFIYRAGFALFGPFDTQGAHLLVVLVVLLTAIGIFAIGKRGAGGAREGVVAAAAFLIFSTTWHDYDALAANCELFLLLPVVLAAWLVLAGPGASEGIGRFLVRQLVIGGLVGLATLCKYQGLVFLGPTAGWLLLRAWRREIGPARACAGVVVQGVGAALPAAAFLAYAAANGSLADSLAWFRFNFLYVGAGLSGLEALQRGGKRLAMIGAMALPVYLLGGAEAIALVGRLGRGFARRAPGLALREWFLLAWLATAAVALCAGGRFFGHYFHLVLPPLALLAAPRVLRRWQGGRAGRVALGLATVIPALTFFLFATVLRPLHERIDHRDPPYPPVAARIAALSAPAERMFVWGNTPQLYLLAERSMGTRFSFCNYMTGESPGTRTETGALDASANSLAASWEMLFADLEARRPAVFVDAAAAGWDGYDKFPVARYPRLRSYLVTHYTRVEAVEGVVIYRRFP